MENFLVEDSAQKELETSKKKSLLLIMLLIVTAIIIGCIGYYLGRQSPSLVPTSSDGLVSNSPDMNSAVLPSASPSPAPSSVTEGDLIFKKRLYKTNEPWLKTENYPELLTSIPEMQLVTLNCTGRYYLDNSDFEYFRFVPIPGTTFEEAEKLMDQKLIAQITNLNEALPSNEKVTSSGMIDAFFSCQTGDNQQILVYELQGGGGGGGNNTAYFQLYDEGKKIDEAKLLNPGVAYFGCLRGLQFTTTNTFYLECGGGDGGLGAKGIFEVNFTSNQVQTLRYCEVWLDGVPECK